MMISVLLIEDDPDFAELVNLGLSRQGTSVHINLHWVQSLSAAFTYLSTSSVDLIIADLGLSDSHGPTTAGKLAPLAETTPFIVLSAEDGDSMMWEVMCRGAEDHLVKADLKPDRLLVAIVNAIARHLERRIEVAALTRMSCQSQP